MPPLDTQNSPYSDALLPLSDREPVLGVRLDIQEMLRTGPTTPSKESDNLCDHVFKDDADELVCAVDHGQAWLMGVHR